MFLISIVFFTDVSMEKIDFDRIICDKSFHNIKCNFNGAQPNGNLFNTIQ